VQSGPLRHPEADNEKPGVAMVCDAGPASLDRKVRDLGAARL